VAGKTIAFDGATGEVWIDPDAQVVETLQLRKAVLEQKQLQAEADRLRPSQTLDGTCIQILANVGSVSDSTIAAKQGAEGIGLLRTEFLFLSRQQPPSEDEQVLALGPVLTGIAGPVIVRTLDVGGDKPLPFLPNFSEHNPYLGVRGIRLSLRLPELFLAHLRAILRAGNGRDLGIMFPMVATLEEVKRAKQFVDQARHDLVARSVEAACAVKLGAMIEVPSAALQIEQLAGELDFFSIGTNDLTQYVMAAERGNSSVAELQDALHPAVLRLIQQVVEVAQGHGKHVSICGDAASDPVAAAVFIGLGVRSLSVRPREAAGIKALVRTLDCGELKQLAREALAARNAAEVRTAARECLRVAWTAAEAGTTSR
jgi:phosphoenolpyruvate-protein phosphotransferase